MKLITPLIPYSGTTFPVTSVRVSIPEKLAVVFTKRITKSSLFIIGLVDWHEPSTSLTTIKPYVVEVIFVSSSVPNNPPDTLLLKLLVLKFSITLLEVSEREI